MRVWRKKISNTGLVFILAVSIILVIAPMNASACRYGCCAAVINGACIGACCPKPEPRCTVSYCGCKAWKTGADKSERHCEAGNWKPCRTSKLATTCPDFCANQKCSKCKHGEEPDYCSQKKD